MEGHLFASQLRDDREYLNQGRLSYAADVDHLTGQPLHLGRGAHSIGDVTHVGEIARLEARRPAPSQPRLR
jgi:hypothetical protein